MDYTERRLNNAIVTGPNEPDEEDLRMAYVFPNFKTKKALRLALANGDNIQVYQPGLGGVPINGSIALEGPHYPEPHKWYATGVMREGKLVSVK